MRRSRLYTGQALSKGDSVSLEGPRAHYLLRVLRVSAGQPVTLFNGDGRDYRGTVESARRDSVTISLQEEREVASESSLAVTLVQGVSRGERMDLTLQKATELGVSALQPIISRRVEVKLDETRLEKRMAHWRGVVISACEQSGRAVVPELAKPMDLGAWLAEPSEARRLVLDPSGEQPMSALADPVAVELVVGPEGGFEEEELRFMTLAGVDPVALGPRILRTETAGPAAIAALQALFGDF